MKAGLASGLALMLASACAISAAADDNAPPNPPVRGGEWNFSALLDGKPIGHHVFRITAQNDEVGVTSDADFDVKVLGLSFYRYRHKDVEHWRDGCLQKIDATTDDNGKPSNVHGEVRGQVFVVSGTTAHADTAGCVMSFAYWNPAIQLQTQLLNAQTGRYERVRFESAGNGSIDVHGHATEARRVRLVGPDAPIDIWFAPNGDWVGLDSIVNGTHKLSYRLD